MYINRKLEGWRTENYNRWLGANTVQTITGNAKYPLSYIAVKGRQLKLSRFPGILSPRCHLCIEAKFILKGSWRDGEAKNINLDLVQIRYKPLRAYKLTAFIYWRMGPTIEIIEISVHPIATLPCLHLGNIYIKRKLEQCRTQKYKPGFDTNTVQTSTGLQITRFLI